MAQPSILPQTETKFPILRSPHDGQSIGVIEGRSRFLVKSDEVNGAYALLEQHVPVGGGPPLHVHRRETEIFYILEGDFEVVVGEQRISAPPGSCAVCPRDVPHTFKNVGTTTGKLLLTIIPGRFGDYFLEVDDVPDSDRGRIRELAAKYDVEILE